MNDIKPSVQILLDHYIKFSFMLVLADRYFIKAILPCQRLFICSFYIVNSYNMTGLLEKMHEQGAGIAQSWECSPPTNVARVRFPDPAFICGLSLLLVLIVVPRVFLRVLRFPSLLKNQNSKFSFDLMHVHFITSSKLFRVTWVNKLHFFYTTHSLLYS